MNIEIANRLVSLRKSNNLSQEALAEKLGISRQAVSKWERAEASPDTDNLIMLARLYKVSLDELLRTEEDIRTAAALESVGPEPVRPESVRPEAVHTDSVDANTSRQPAASLGNGSFAEPEPGQPEKGQPEKGQPDRTQAAQGQPVTSQAKQNHTVLEGTSETMDSTATHSSATHSTAADSSATGSEAAGERADSIYIKDKYGSEIHVGPDGIHVHDVKSDDSISVDTNGICRNGKKYEGSIVLRHQFPMAVLICFLYFVIGVFFGAWHPGWLLFLLIPIWHSLVEAVVKRNAYCFAWPVFVTLLFLCAGFFLGWWHPAWLLFLTTPMYYSVVAWIRHENRRNS